MRKKSPRREVKRKGRSGRRRGVVGLLEVFSMVLSPPSFPSPAIMIKECD